MDPLLAEEQAQQKRTHDATYREKWVSKSHACASP